MKRILVCLDGSPRASHVLNAAVDMARRNDAKLLLFRAVGLPPELPSSFYSVSPNELPKMLCDEAKEQLVVLSREVPPELIADISTRVGVPWDAICTTAKEQDVDLVVVGSHGYRGLDRLLGTTAAKVVNHVDRSVLVVR